MPNFQIDGYWYNDMPSFAAARARHLELQKAGQLKAQPLAAKAPAQPVVRALPAVIPPLGTKWCDLHDGLCLVSYRSCNGCGQDGFTVPVPGMTPPRIRNYLKLYLGWKLSDFPDIKAMVEKGIVDVHENVTPYDQGKVAPPTPADLMRFVIAKSNKQRPTISTDPDPSCGGYRHSYAYFHEIHGIDLVKREWSAAVTGRTVVRGAFWPDLYLNAPTLDTATHIAIHNNVSSVETKELTYFTDIPKDFIVSFEDNKSGQSFRLITGRGKPMPQWSPTPFPRLAA